MTDQDRIDEARLDRLVDGELSGAEYREVLATLDAEPGGWRRVALAFLEAQAWADELPAVARAAELPRRAPARPRAPLRFFPLLLAAAASFLLAFWLGVAWDRPRASNGPSLPLAGIGQPEALPAEAPSEFVASDKTLEDQPPQPRWGHMTLVMDRGDGSSEEFNVPIYRPSDEQGDRALHERLAVPLDLRRAMQQAGYEMRDEIRWTPLETDDGRYVVVPLGQLEITPVSGQLFQ